MPIKRTLNINTLKKRFQQLDKESNDAWTNWSELKKQRDAALIVLGMYGVEMKETKSGADRTSMATDQRTSLSPLREKIAEIYAEAKKPVKASVIRKQLREKNIPFTAAQFWRTMSRMEGKGVLKRLGGGVYQLTNGAS